MPDVRELGQLLLKRDTVMRSQLFEHRTLYGALLFFCWIACCLFISPSSDGRVSLFQAVNSRRPNKSAISLIKSPSCTQGATGGFSTQP